MSGARIAAEGRSHRRLRRALVVVGLLIVVAGAGATGWWAATRFESPAQRAAAAAAPSALPVFAAVQQGTLSEQITADASVAPAQQHKVPLTLPAQAPAAVVTRQFVTDGTLKQTAPVLAVNDRPVFAISGSFPLWRDLSPGMTGEDVRQLQLALRDAGHSIPDREFGTFGRATTTAVRAMYKAAGYPVATTTAQTSPADPSGQASTTQAGDQAPAATPVLSVPASELIVVTDGLPARVSGLPAVGTVLTSDNAVVSIDAGAPTATADLPAAVASRVTTGTSGTLRVGDQTPVPVRVAELIAGDATAGTNPKAVIAAAEGATIPQSWEGSQGLLALTLTSVADQSLLVPTRAVAVGPDGSATVLKHDNGALTAVAVHVVGELRGISAVAPVQDDALRIGDEVKVG